MAIREVESKDFKSIFPLMAQLRPHLSETEFLNLLSEAQKTSDYRLVGFYQNSQCVGLMGYRILTDFVHGKHVYIDDLVVDESLRSSGIGAKLLQHAKDVAKQNGCTRLRLCTGPENKKGMAFYERNGWEQRAVVYKTKLS
jgi:ribosomal protein S18 acetylase RimI-like enzyme